jgi:hypothetical protein
MAGTTIHIPLDHQDAAFRTLERLPHSPSVVSTGCKQNISLSMSGYVLDICSHIRFSDRALMVFRGADGGCLDQ